jgi:hypothetical protein
VGVDLKEQIGPLPLGAWLAVVGGGLGIAYYSRRAGVSATPPQVVEDTSNPAGVGQGPGWIAVPPPSSGPAAPAGPTTNEEWGRLAINWLIAQGYDPALSDSAIRKYLETQELTVQEYALLQAALRQFGSPPVPLPSPPSAPKIPGPVVVTPPVVAPPPQQPPPPPPVQQPVAAPPQLRYVGITPWPTRRSTLWGIARDFYGDGRQWPRIFEVNRNGYRRPDGSVGWINNPNLIYAGRVVWVP